MSLTELCVRVIASGLTCAAAWPLFAIRKKKIDQTARFIQRRLPFADLEAIREELRGQERSQRAHYFAGIAMACLSIILGSLLSRWMR